MPLIVEVAHDHVAGEYVFNDIKLFLMFTQLDKGCALPSELSQS